MAKIGILTIHGMGKQDSDFDRGLRERILPYLERIRDELAIPMLYVSHAEAEVRAMADWVVVLDAGRVARSGSTG